MNPPVNLELIRPNPGDVIVMSVDFSNGPTIDAIQEAFCSLSTTFPQNRIICVPDGMSMVMANKDTLIDIRNSVNQILKSIEEREVNE